MGRCLHFLPLKIFSGKVFFLPPQLQKKLRVKREVFFRALRAKASLWVAWRPTYSKIRLLLFMGIRGMSNTLNWELYDFKTLAGNQDLHEEKCTLAMIWRISRRWKNLFQKRCLQKKKVWNRSCSLHLWWWPYYFTLALFFSPGGKFAPPQTLNNTQFPIYEERLNWEVFLHFFGPPGDTLAGRGEGVRGEIWSCKGSGRTCMTDFFFIKKLFIR